MLDTIEQGKINIKDLALEAPERIDGKLPFDIFKELTSSDLNEIEKDLNNQRFYDRESNGHLAFCLRLFKPDHHIKRLDDPTFKESFETAIDHYKGGVEHSGASWFMVSELAVLFKGTFPGEKINITEEEKAKMISYMNGFDHTNSYLSVLKGVKAIDPGFNQNKLDINDLKKGWYDLHLRRYPTEDDNAFESRMIYGRGMVAATAELAGLRLAFPDQQVTDILAPQFWNYAKTAFEIEKAIARQTADWNLLARFAVNIAIATAPQLRITESGIRAGRPEPISKPNQQPLPLLRSF